MLLSITFIRERCSQNVKGESLLKARSNRYTIVTALNSGDNVTVFKWGVTSLTSRHWRHVIRALYCIACWTAVDCNSVVVCLNDVVFYLIVLLALFGDLITVRRIRRLANKAYLSTLKMGWNKWSQQSKF